MCGDDCIMLFAACVEQPVLSCDAFIKKLFVLKLKNELLYK